MPDLTDLIARTVNPSMPRAERDKVYAVVRQTVLNIQGGEGRPPHDPRRALQHHLIEETIRNIESDIARFLVLEKLQAARATQDTANRDGARSRT